MGFCPHVRTVSQLSPGPLWPGLLFNPAAVAAAPAAWRDHYIGHKRSTISEVAESQTALAFKVDVIPLFADSQRRPIRDDSYVINLQNERIEEGDERQAQ